MYERSLTLVRSNALFERLICRSVQRRAGDTSVQSSLLDRNSIYIQSINYPTVERGSERLRIAATPYHTSEMIDQLVDGLKQGWLDVGLALKPNGITAEQLTP